jgi:Ca-activated chloride channel family protein
VTKSRLIRALMVLLAMTVVAAGWSAPLSARGEDPAKVLLLLDVSGSMNEKISSGGTKFAAAKRALKQVADALPAGTQVGLRVYGSEIAEPKESNPRACRDTELVLPIGPLNRDKMYRAVDSFEAVGETPIAYSLGRRSTTWATRAAASSC